MRIDRGRFSTVRTAICLVASVLAFWVSGCSWGSRAADRTLEIYQFQSTGTYTGSFQIDTSQLPPDAIETRVDSGSQGVPVTRLTIDSQYPIRIVFVPATQP